MGLGKANLTGMTRATSRILAAAALPALVLAGCGASGADSSAPTSSSTPSGAEASASPAPSSLASGMGSQSTDGVFPRTVKHFRGSTTISSRPTRVVVLSTGQFDDVLGLGVVPVGTTSASTAELVPDYLTTAFPQQATALKKVTSVGSRKAPDLEAIANLKPDLVLVNNTLENTSTYTALSKIAPTVVTQGNGVNWKQDFLLVGAALGRQQQAQQQLAGYAKRAATLGSAVDDSTTVSFALAQSARTRIWGTRSFVGSIATDAGLARPASQQFARTSQDISSEQLDQADADWLFYGVEQGQATTLTSAPLWSSLKAVSAGHAVEVDDEMFYLNAGITAANGVLGRLEKSLES